MDNKEKNPPKVRNTDGLTLKKRGGQRLTREQVQEIREGRKKLRREMRERGIKSRKEFELTASSLGLYFDRPRFGFLWFFSGRGLWALLGALGLLALVLTIFSMVTQMRGLFTINLSQGMFREGYSLSEEITFRAATGNLFSQPAVDVPCISVVQIPDKIYDNSVWENPVSNDQQDTTQKYRDAGCFYYTFYIRNEGESETGYVWDLNIDSEDKKLADALWVMVFEDEEMTFYAKADEQGAPQALPAEGNNTVGYRKAPFIDMAKNPEQQYSVIAEREDFTYYRLRPVPFLSETLVASGQQETVAPQEIHKYTVVLWVEGDDPHCTDELIGGHVGLSMQFRLVDESKGKDETSRWWDGLDFWND
ncbi:MAG: hypothetical protein E7421_03470 [Ruminococcaceae bacterium]|nr:hypothetical protein [Oscillospiraceae bacterium]